MKNRNDSHDLRGDETVADLNSYCQLDSFFEQPTEAPVLQGIISSLLCFQLIV
jgi:hypothetical protein